MITGDIFIADNAKTHFSEDIVEALELLLAGSNVTLIFLPTYSPELNPCELVFG
jgi:transposase